MPPLSSGTMWSGTVAAVTRPRAAQSRHSGSASRRRRRNSTARLPRMRSLGRRATATAARAGGACRAAVSAGLGDMGCRAPVGHPAVGDLDRAHRPRRRRRSVRRRCGHDAHRLPYSIAHAFTTIASPHACRQGSPRKRRGRLA